MAGGLNIERLEQLRVEKFREATEHLTDLEQKGLNDIFPTLDTITGRVEASDRGAMLELLAIAAGSLRWFDVLPQQTREALADGLEKMRNNLEEAKKFLPRRRGERSKKEKVALRHKEFVTAFALEHVRRVDGLSLEEAIAKLADESGMTDSLILKRWKRSHKAAKESLDMVVGTMESLGAPMPKKLRRKKRRP